jgi:NADH-quinone oxidoreductase subunit M
MLMAGMLEKRFASNDLTHLGGLAKPLPKFTLVFFGLIFASLGLPGTSGFIAEAMLLLGVAKTFPVMLGVMLLGSFVAAIYSVSFLKKAFWGPVRHQALFLSDDLKLHETILLIAVMVLIVIFGLLPDIVLSFQAPGLEFLLSSIART